MKVKSLFSLLFSSTALVAMMTFITGCDKDDPAPEPNTIVKVATDNGFTTLVSAARTAGLEATLTGPGPLTVFAPTNAAFSAITVPSDPNVLKNILLYHTLGAKVEAAQVLERPLTYGVLTANGTDSVYVKRAGTNVFINGVRVDLADVQAVNGVVHAIGTVLLPPTGDLVQTVISRGYDSLAVAVTVASTGPGSEPLLTALSNVRGATLFAPTNQAFRDLLSALSLPNIAAIPKATLISVLKQHVVTIRGFSTDLSEGLVLPTLNPTGLTVTLTGGARVKGPGNPSAVAISRVNLVAKNGCVIHEVAGVLRP